MTLLTEKRQFHVFLYRRDNEDDDWVSYSLFAEKPCSHLGAPHRQQPYALPPDPIVCLGGWPGPLQRPFPGNPLNALTRDLSNPIEVGVVVPHNSLVKLGNCGNQ